MKTTEQRLQEILAEWSAPQNELSRKATNIHMPNMYHKADFGANVGVSMHKVNVRNTKTGKSYGSKAIPERNISEEKTPLLAKALELVSEAEARKNLNQQLKAEHTSLKKQIVGLKKEVGKIAAAGGEIEGHPYKKALTDTKVNKKQIKKLRKKLKKGKSVKKVEKKASEVIKGGW